MTESERIEVLGFLRKNPMGVLSTIHYLTAAPESALVAFAETPTFELIFQTLTTSRKYSNLALDSRVSFVTGWEIEKPQQITFQYEGLAKELDSTSSEYHRCRQIFEEKKTPCTAEFLNNPDSRLFIISPSWFGYSDYTKEIPRIIEHPF
jgi:hypothetical protein